MTEQTNSQRAVRFLVIAATLVIIIGGISQARSVLVSSLVAVFLAMLGTPPVLWLERKRVPSVVAILLVVTGMTVVLLVVGGLVGTSLNSFVDALPSYEQRTSDQVGGIKTLLATKGIRVTDKTLMEYTNPGAVLKLAVGMLGSLGSVLSNMVLIILTVTFILFEASSFPDKLRAVLGDPHQVFPQFTTFVNDIKRYMIIKTAVSLTAGILIWIWLTILGVDSPILWGFLAFVLHYVPNVGALIAAIPAVVLSLVQTGISSAMLTASGYLVITFVLGNVVEPKLMGQRLGLSTLVVFLSLIFWGSLLGLIGVILCIPFTMTLKFACESNESTRWIAVLLGPSVPAEGILADGEDLTDVET